MFDNSEQIQISFKENIEAAFDILFDEFEELRKYLLKMFNQKIEKNYIEESDKIYEKIKQINSFKQDLEKVREKFEKLMTVNINPENTNAITYASTYKNTIENNHVNDMVSLENYTRKHQDSEPSYRRVRKGMKTPEKAYYRPILEFLVKLGGQAKAHIVLDLIYESMKDKFKEVDLERLNSGKVRWHNTAQWARLELINLGLLEKDSPYGIWKISEKGRKALEEGGYFDDKEGKFKSFD
ncbi:MAG: winged helix-turn-helix domain-containing protein, partial [Fervidobacterium sp.]